MVTTIDVMRSLLAVICAWGFVGNAYAMPATVDYVVDGDTLSAIAHVDAGTDVNVRVRLINIDTPELHGECEGEIKRANMARDRLKNLVPRGTVVNLENIKDDKYIGRIDANVVLPDGRDVGRVLIREKLGRPSSGGKRAGWCE